MFAMFNILFAVHNYLFVIFDFFRKNEYLFVLLKYLFLIDETNYLILLKKIYKISCKYRQVWSYFKDLVIKKIMVQSKFNLHIPFKIYNFFKF